MVEDGGGKSTRLIIGISYPQMNFNSTKKMRTTQDVRLEELYYMRSQNKVIWVLLRNKVHKDNFQVYVDGKAMDKQDAERYIRIFSFYGSPGSLVYFTNLLNGFTTEVHLYRSPNVEA